MSESPSEGTSNLCQKPLPRSPTTIAQTLIYYSDQGRDIFRRLTLVNDDLVDRDGPISPQQCHQDYPLYLFVPASEKEGIGTSNGDNGGSPSWFVLKLRFPLFTERPRVGVDVFRFISFHSDYNSAFIGLFSTLFISSSQSVPKSIIPMLVFGLFQRQEQVAGKMTLCRLLFVCVFVYSTINRSVIPFFFSVPNLPSFYSHPVCIEGLPRRSPGTFSGDL